MRALDTGNCTGGAGRTIARSGRRQRREPAWNTCRPARRGRAVDGRAAIQKKSPSNEWSEGLSNGGRRHYLLSHKVALAVPSAQRGLTSEFGMGSGVSPALSSPAEVIVRIADRRRTSNKCGAYRDRVDAVPMSKRTIELLGE